MRKYNHTGYLYQEDNGNLYLKEHVNSYIRELVDKSLFVAQYGTALEFKEYMLSKLLEIREEFGLEENDND